MRSALYPKIAVDGIRKNSKLYVPYIATCILMVAVFYIMHTLGFSDMLSNFMGAATAKDILGFGTFVMAVFGTIFLFYTQSALIKGRLKEFGLYSVLGMNRKNLGKVVFYGEDGRVHDDIHGQVVFNFNWSEAQKAVVKSEDTNTRLITVTPEQRQKYVEAYKKYISSKK